MDLLPARDTANKIGEKARSVNGIFPLLLLLVLTFLLMLGLSRGLDDDLNEKTFDEEHIDYPKSNRLSRYCNSMMLLKRIRGPNDTCKRKHTFIHEKLDNLVSLCTNFTTLTTCKYPSRMDCHQSPMKLQLTDCRLIEGTKFPGCKYKSLPKFNSILFNCDELGPVYLHGIVEDS
ncbi:probable inactive ribonuclease-like protein 12 [Trichosurus vulpecula]|uniref:probable inactive ribonuclease-like protein 12 n=1 Tax=Trichosurus vulpecula TaxID=9337 RepID=UPI00186ABDF5|nr:probable inactive ribonuclease-like protein 12 [Trichosurus vulpecula]